MNQPHDCTELFQLAYENRYTWDTGFLGYKGRCSWSNGIKEAQGNFTLASDFKSSVNDIQDKNITNAIAAQLWEVAIHRVRRSFNQTHGQNTFRYRELKGEAVEVLVGGKCEGDKYHIKDNVVTLVHRHIHGKLIVISTKEVIHTGRGYISKSYTSEYFDDKTGEKLKGICFYSDEFVPLHKGGPWVLSHRTVEERNKNNSVENKQSYKFYNLSSLI